LPHVQQPPPSLLTFIKIWRGQQADTTLRQTQKNEIKQRKGSPVAAAAQ